MAVSSLLKWSKNEETQTSQRVCIPSISSHSPNLSSTNTAILPHSHYYARGWHFSANPLLRQEEWVAEPQQSLQTALGSLSEHATDVKWRHQITVCTSKLWNMLWRLGHFLSKAPLVPDIHRVIPCHFHPRLSAVEPAFIRVSFSASCPSHVPSVYSSEEVSDKRLCMSLLSESWISLCTGLLLAVPATQEEVAAWCTRTVSERWEPLASHSPECPGASSSLSKLLRAPWSCCCISLAPFCPAPSESTICTRESEGGMQFPVLPYTASS